MARRGADRDVADELRRRGAAVARGRRRSGTGARRWPTAAAGRRAARARSASRPSAAPAARAARRPRSRRSSGPSLCELVALARRAAARRSRARARARRRRRSAARARLSTNSSSSAAPVCARRSCGRGSARSRRSENGAQPTASSITSRTASASLPTRRSGASVRVTHEAAHRLDLAAAARMHADSTACADLPLGHRENPTATLVPSNRLLRRLRPYRFSRCLALIAVELARQRDLASRPVRATPGRSPSPARRGARRSPRRRRRHAADRVAARSA